MAAFIALSDGRRQEFRKERQKVVDHLAVHAQEILALALHQRLILLNGRRQRRIIILMK